MDEAPFGEDRDFRPRELRDWMENPEQAYSRLEIQQLIERGIMALPANYRTVVMLRDIEHLPIEEIARQLGLSVPTVKGASAARPAHVAGVARALLCGRQENGSMITCDEFFAEFGDYIENRVSPEVRNELELHLSQCRACHVLYDSTCQTVKIVTESGSFDLPQNVTESIIGEVMARLRSGRD